MKATVVAQNKKYLVEFKSDEQMISFLTNHGHQVEKLDIINEETLPAMEKPVELPKISKPTGWKTLEKSAVSDMTKETGAETKSMKLGGKYNTFKYEPDASLESNTSNKNSEGSIDSPALKGDEPKVSSVEDTKEVKSVKQPKVSYKDMEDDSEEDTETEEKEEVSESVKDFLPRGGFIKDDETERKEGIWGGQGTDEQIRKAKLIAKVKHANGDRMGRVTKEDLDNYASYLEQYQEIFGLDESDEEIFESVNDVVWGDIIDWANKSLTDLYAQQHVNDLVFKSRIKGIVECLAGAAAYAWDEPIENIKKRLFSSELMKIVSNDTEIKNLNEDITANPIAKSQKVSYFVRHQRDGSWVIVKYENGEVRIFSTFDSDEYDEAEAECERLNSELINESSNEETKKHEDKDDEFEKTHECSWCGEKFSESEMRCEKDMGWLCEHDWRYLESKEGDLEEVDPSETGLDETETNEDYQNGFEEGKFAYESGHFISLEDRNDLEGDSESEEFWRGYDDGYESAKEGLDDSEEELEENEDPITRNPYADGDDIASYAKSSMWRPEDEELEEGFKDGLKKAGKFAKNAVAGAAVAGSLMTANPTNAQISPDGTNSTDGYLQAQVEDEGTQRVKYADIVKAGKPVTINGYTYSVEDLEQTRKEHGFDEVDMDDIVNGIDPYYDGATRPFADSDETLEDYLKSQGEEY